MGKEGFKNLRFLRAHPLLVQLSNHKYTLRQATLYYHVPGYIFHHHLNRVRYLSEKSLTVITFIFVILKFMTVKLVFCSFNYTYINYDVGKTKKGRKNHFSLFYLILTRLQ